MDYLDFDLEVEAEGGRTYRVAVRSPEGETRQPMLFPFDKLELENALLKLQNALLKSGGQQRATLAPEEQAVQDFGQSLFETLFSGNVRALYDACRTRAMQEGRPGVRLRLRLLAPDLAALPWEFLYDARRGEYLCLSRRTPLVRHLEVAQTLLPLQITPPLRILAMIASPSDQDPLKVERERERLRQALQNLEARELVKLEWLPGQTWRDLQRAMRGGPWHVFHFIGHGGFHPQAQEGVLALVNDEGTTHLLGARQLSLLLANHVTLRLALLNACEGATSNQHDLFSSTAATLARHGIPAVLAMQYAISDAAAIECSRAFYEALAEGLPVDSALAEARTAIHIGVNNSLEWGTPVLYLRSQEGVLFTLQAGESSPTPRPESDRELPSVTPADTDHITPDRAHPSTGRAEEVPSHGKAPELLAVTGTLPEITSPSAVTLPSAKQITTAESASVAPLADGISPEPTPLIDLVKVTEVVDILPQQGRERKASVGGTRVGRRAHWAVSTLTNLPLSRALEVVGGLAAVIAFFVPSAVAGNSLAVSLQTIDIACIYPFLFYNNAAGGCIANAPNFSFLGLGLAVKGPGGAWMEPLGALLLFTGALLIGKMGRLAYGMSLLGIVLGLGACVYIYQHVQLNLVNPLNAGVISYNVHPTVIASNDPIYLYNGIPYYVGNFWGPGFWAAGGGLIVGLIGVMIGVWERLSKKASVPKRGEAAPPGREGRVHLVGSLLMSIPPGELLVAVSGLVAAFAFFVPAAFAGHSLAGSLGASIPTGDASVPPVNASVVPTVGGLGLAWLELIGALILFAGRLLVGRIGKRAYTISSFGSVLGLGTLVYVYLHVQLNLVNPLNNGLQGLPGSSLNIQPAFSGVLEGAAVYQVGNFLGWAYWMAGLAFIVGLLGVGMNILLDKAGKQGSENSFLPVGSLTSERNHC